MTSLRHRRGTRAQIDAAAAANGLQTGEIYLISDEGRLTVGTALNAHVPAAKQSEAGALSEDPASPLTARVLVDDFVTQSNETGEVGFLNWSFTNGSVAAVNNVQNHPGIQRRTGGIVAAQVASLYLGALVGTTVFRFDEWDECNWIFAQAAAGIADTTFQFGLFGAVGTLTPVNGVYLEKLPADTNWFFVCRNNSLQTRVDSGVSATTTAWIKIRMRRVSAGEVRFAINGGAEIALTTNIPDPASSFNVGQQHAATGTIARSVDLDFFSLKLRPVLR
jgi:hypothetical protein